MFGRNENNSRTSSVRVVQKSKAESERPGKCGSVCLSEEGANKGATAV